MYALLLAEDSDESAILTLALQRAGLAVSAAGDLERALQGWSERPADLILIAAQRQSDPMALVRRVRTETEVPLVLIADALRENEHCALLDNGADLVLTRPVSVRLLISQLRAMLRRGSGLPVFSLPTLSLAGLVLDPTTRTVRVAGRPDQRLTNLEFRLLYTLMIHRGQVLPTETIIDLVWGYGGKGDGYLVQGLRSLISRLRAKIELDPQQPRYILTVPGVGYSFRREGE